MTAPVGCFPSGRREHAPAGHGIDDLCGNIWEWTRSEARPYPYRVTDGRDDVERSVNRVLRGGAYNSKLVSGSYRESGTQVFRSGAVGFRVVLEPFGD